MSVTLKEVVIFALSAHGPSADANEKLIKKNPEKSDSDMLVEYNFSPGVRGKYARRYTEGTNVVVLEPNAARVFPNADAVNSSLRALAQIIQRREKSTPNPR